MFRLNNDLSDLVPRHSWRTQCWKLWIFASYISLRELCRKSVLLISGNGIGETGLMSDAKYKSLAVLEMLA